MSIQIYTSSAGSGKTYTLAKEYVKLLMDNPFQHGRILAVTFTNKATQEMKERILEFLKQLSVGSNPDLAQQLEEETSLSATAIQANAGQALKNILHQYGDLAIYTIDSFFNGLIKSFAHEVKLPLQMEVQLDIDEPIQEAIDNLLADLNSNPLLANYLLEMIREKMSQGSGWNVDTEISQLGSDLFKETFDRVFAQLDKIELVKIQKLSLGFVEEIKTIENNLQSFGKKWFDILEANDLTVDDFSYSTGGIGSWGIKLMEVNYEKMDAPGTRILSAINDSSKWATAKSSKRVEVIELADLELIPLYHASQTYWSEVGAKYKVLVNVRSKMWVLGLLKSLNDKIIQYRDAHDKIFISDQNRIINQIIEQADISFIYEKTGTRFKHFLLDEFQDTSELQWTNFRPLLENALSEGGQVLIVGDAKQSIYRWRGGHMPLLLQDVPHDLKIFMDEKSNKVLTSNYRSLQEVVEFNNFFFQNLSDQVEISIEENQQLATLAYQEVAQKAARKGQKSGYVSVEFFAEEDDIPAKERIDDQIVNHIKDLVNEGYLYKDIACLVFTNNEGVRLSELFRLHNIPIRSDESLELGRSAYIRLIIAAIKSGQQMESKLFRGELIVLLHRLKLIQGDLHAKLLAAQVSFEEYVKQIPTGLGEYLRHSKGSLQRQLSKIIEACQIADCDAPYLLRLQEIIYDFETKENAHTQQFLDWWEEKGQKKAVQIDKSQNAVMIQTVHKSKGLQYPVVIMPYLQRSVEPNSKSILWFENKITEDDWLDYVPIRFDKKLINGLYDTEIQNEMDKSLIDAVNMLYVGFTRAEERLYVLPAEPTRKSGKDKTNLLASFVKNCLSTSPDLQDYFSDQSFSYGEKSAPSPKEKNTQPTAATASLAIAETVSLRLSRSDHSIADLCAGANQQMETGVLLHELLAEVNQKEDIPAVIEKAQIDGQIALHRQEYWQNKLAQIISFSPYQKLINEADRQVNEKEIISPNGLLRPDKLLISPETICIIDFKTGKKEAQHQMQIVKYAKAIADISQGRRKISGYIYYTEEPALIQVSLENLFI